MTPPRPLEPVTGHVLKRTGWDAYTYDRAVSSLPALRDAERVGGLGRAYWPALVQDVHASLYQLRPQLDPSSTAPAEHRGLLAELADPAGALGADWAGLRANTRLDLAASTLAAVEMTGRLAAGLPPESQPEERRSALRDAIQGTGEAVEAAQDAMALLGNGANEGKGQGGLTDAGALAKLASALKSRPGIKRILQLAGRLRRTLAQVRASRPKAGPGAVVGIEAGDDLLRVLPEELAFLGTPLEVDFTRRYVERQLLQVKQEAEEHVERGPIVVCLDSSGSMAGERDIWAKAVALTLLTLARDEKREFSLIIFSDASEVKRFAWPTTPDVGEIIQALTLFYGGGTSFEAPLTLAASACAESRFKHADIIMVTDGCCSLSSSFEASFKARKAAKGFKLYSIFIECHGDNQLSRLSDGVEWVDDTNKAEGALKLAFGI